MLEPAITIDLDWAPDYMIEPMAETLIQRDVRATWLITHISSAVDALRHHPDLFELGIHPNFHPGSSHGKTPQEVIDHCMGLVPSARCVRTHGLLQSTLLLRELGRHEGLHIDLSLFLRRCKNATSSRFEYRDAHLLRLPHIWEDDMEMVCTDPDWLIDPILRLDGLKVLAFHPVHVYLNCPNGTTYQVFKRRRSPGSEAASVARQLRKTGYGPATMFEQAVDYLMNRGGGERISDLAARIDGSDHNLHLADPIDQKTA